MQTTVKHILDSKGRDFWFVAPHDTVEKAVKLMADRGIGALVVMSEGSIVGIFSERDLARKVLKLSPVRLDVPVNEMMSHLVYYINPGMSVNDCMTLMTEKHIRHLPVIENQKPVGLISIGDVVNAVIKDQKSAIRDLENYISGGSYGSGM